MRATSVVISPRRKTLERKRVIFAVPNVYTPLAMVALDTRRAQDEARLDDAH